MNGSLGVGLATGLVLLAVLLGGVPAVDAGPTERATAPAVGPAGTTLADVQDDGATGFPQQSEETDQFDRFEFRITVHDNGTGVWTFSYVRQLDNESERRQFESFADEFRNNESHPLYTGFRNQATALVGAGDSATGREMNASHFRRNATVEERINDRGVVTMSFHWSNFAQRDGDRLVVGDVFEGGLAIREDQRLVFQRGGGLEFAEALPTEGRELSNDSLATSDTVTWEGPAEFTDNKPRLVLAPAGSGSLPPDETETAPASDAGDTWMMMAGVVILLLGVGSAVAWRRDGTVLRRSRSESAAEGAAVDQSASAEPDAEAGGEPAVPDEELLTDEDRVTSLLEENGGRMKQVNIVEETGWSKSKVSMLLSDMEEEGDISKLRVGRENIISLDGHEPEAAGSPFENDE